ncbi:MAG: hypothetical protein N2111_14560 [Candidatus Sumerlaeaceae bacterium]|nr:hypothetical protein [Candidatus Sumerlaeaceae bacterium]
MDIRSGGDYPSSALSNFAGHRFFLDGVQCNSMEGFLQSLKFKNPDMQVEVCKLIGKGAKMKGMEKNWRVLQTLYWRGEAINRHSQEYQDLLDRAYNAMFEQSESFRNALAATGNAVLTHSIGNTDDSETILTRKEFCSRLMKLREKLK